MPKQLKDLALSEVSLVDEGANPGARVALFKRKKEDEPMGIETIIKKADASKAEIFEAAMAFVGKDKDPATSWVTARAKFWHTPLGHEVRERMRKAGGPPIASPAPPTSPSAALGEITKAANKLCEEGRFTTIAAARTHIRKWNGQLAEKERAERADALADAYPSMYSAN